MNVEHIYGAPQWDGAELLAIVVSSRFHTPGLSFFTEPTEGLQAGHLCYPKGKVIDAHIHQDVARTIRRTQEALFVKAGRLRVDLYTSGKELVCKRELVAGDSIILLSGGHGFEVLEDLSCGYVKLGPYMGEQDKARFFTGGNHAAV